MTCKHLSSKALAFDQTGVEIVGVFDVSEITAGIKSAAIRLGFHKVGVAKAGRARTAGLLEEWLGRGYHGSMAWMNNDQRPDPRTWVPNAKSVIAVALNYYTPHRHQPGTGKISRYAWGDDYHDVMKQKLDELWHYVRSVLPDVQGKRCVDTAPVMDKYWAVEAGIGWQGKHSNVITREMGSWIFLGEVIIDHELEYDKPIGDFCGTCHRCIDACPTDAIVQPYVVDSRKCISYMTIESKEQSLSPEQAKSFDNWIYGCDICQDVCPWNTKYSQETDIKEFMPRFENIDQTLESLSKLDEASFQSRFRRSAVKRTKWKGLIRNVVALITARQI